MTHYDWLSLLLGLIGVILVPILVLLFRGVIKWTRTEDRLGQLVNDVQDLVGQQDKVHNEIIAQMRYDRDATNKRLRYLEEYFMQAGMGKR